MTSEIEECEKYKDKLDIVTGLFYTCISQRTGV